MGGKLQQEKTWHSSSSLRWARFGQGSTSKHKTLPLSLVGKNKSRERAEVHRAGGAWWRATAKKAGSFPLLCKTDRKAKVEVMFACCQHWWGSRGEQRSRWAATGEEGRRTGSPTGTSSSLPRCERVGRLPSEPTVQHLPPEQHTAPLTHLPFPFYRQLFTHVIRSWATTQTKILNCYYAPKIYRRVESDSSSPRVPIQTSCNREWVLQKEGGRGRKKFGTLPVAELSVTVSAVFQSKYSNAACSDLFIYLIYGTCPH